MLSFTNFLPEEGIQILVERIEPIPREQSRESIKNFQEIAGLLGRVLAEPLVMDRPSPALDVSAMDGFAVRSSEILAGPVKLQSECRIGEAPIRLEEGTAARIYTGSPLPEGADTVLRLEYANHREGVLSLADNQNLKMGADIRRQGENAQAGDEILPSGVQLTAAAISAAASVGSIALRKPIKVTILNTGNEVLPSTAEAIPDWCLRDSNGPALESILLANRWIGKVNRICVEDELKALTDQLADSLNEADAVVLTGGVSKGAHDYVADAIQAVGGEILFHGLMARPGRPTLGAIKEGKPILGLPGNPLAVLTTGHRIVLPILRKLAGFANPRIQTQLVELDQPAKKTIDFCWWRPVRLLPEGKASIVKLLGSGDVCGPAGSDGFIEVPPNRTDVGPYHFYPWV